MTSGGTKSRGMVPEDLFRINWVSDAQISPDGSLVAFTVTWLDADADDYKSAIWVVPTDGGKPRRFTYGPRKDSAPRWSPDGSRLAFLSDRDGGKTQLYVIDRGGGEGRKLTALAENAGSPVWSPDGSRIVVGSRVPTANQAAGKVKTPPARVITTARYRANGEGFTYDRRLHLFVVDAVSGLTRQLTDGDWDDAQGAWSPDSRRIAFVSARCEGHDRDVDQGANEIYVVDADGGEPRQVTPIGGKVALPSWSPDGATLAYLGFADALDSPLNSRLWLIAADGSSPPRCVTASYDRPLEILDSGSNPGQGQSSAAPRWTADGCTISTGVMDRGTSGVTSITLQDGTVSRPVQGARSVSSYSIARDGALAFVASDPSRPAEVFLLHQSEERQLTDLNGEWRAEVDLPEPEHFTVACDGMEVDAWLVRPAGYEAGRRYPTLVNVHGGPFNGSYTGAFVDNTQVEAGAGYAVLYCNFRGSGGSGEAFARANIGTPNETESADVLAVLDAAIERFDCIDPGRLGIIGESYGGGVALWIIAHTNRFAAACSGVGTTNRFSKEGTSALRTGYTYHRVRAWEDPALYMRYSPMSYVCSIETPLLIVHGEEDLNGPIEQAEQMFVALKQAGREVRFVRFPGENHFLSRSGKPSHRMQRFEHILDWFGSHV